jgi:hypothetical protein
MNNKTMKTQNYLISHHFTILPTAFNKHLATIMFKPLLGKEGRGQRVLSFAQQERPSVADGARE